MEFLHQHWAGLANGFALGLSIGFLWDANKAQKKALQSLWEARAWYMKTQMLLDRYRRELDKFDAKFGLGGGEDDSPPKDRVN